MYYYYLHQLNFVANVGDCAIIITLKRSLLFFIRFIFVICEHCTLYTDNVCIARAILKQLLNHPCLSYIYSTNTKARTKDSL